MKKQVNLIIGVSRLFTYLVRHTVHKSARWETPQVDHFEDENAIHTIARCLCCGKSYGFKTKKS